MINEYYMQETLSCGEDMYFWAQDKAGYTKNVSHAHVFSKDEAFRQNRIRPSDKPWPKAFIDSIARTTVDTNEALSGIGPMSTGIALADCEKISSFVRNCGHCGRFFSCSMWNQHRCSPCLFKGDY